jgi:hypothetical protein
MHPIAASFVQIFSDSGGTVGTGYLIENERICTCAHVCAHAVNQPDLKQSSEPPKKNIMLAFPFFSEKKYVGKIVAWSPDLPGEADAALLEVLDEPPAGARALPVIVASDLMNSPFEVHGYQTGTSFDITAEGRIGACNARGWFELIGEGSHGYFVQQGFSGGAVWDVSRQASVGMIKAVATDVSVRVAFLVPNKTLADRLPGYAQSRQSQLLTFTQERSRLYTAAAKQRSEIRDIISARLSQLVHQTPDPTERYWIYITLGDIGGDASIAFLRRAVDHESDAFGRRGIEEALHEI